MELSQRNTEPNRNICVKQCKGYWLSAHLAFTVLPLGPDTQPLVYAMSNSNFLHKETLKLKATSIITFASFNSSNPLLISPFSKTQIQL